MSITRKIRSALAAVLCMGMLTACQSAPQVSAPESASSAAESVSAADSSADAQPPSLKIPQRPPQGLRRKLPM